MTLPLDYSTQILYFLMVKNSICLQVEQSRTSLFKAKLAFLGSLVLCLINLFTALVFSIPPQNIRKPLI